MITSPLLRKKINNCIKKVGSDSSLKIEFKVLHKVGSIVKVFDIILFISYLVIFF